MEMAVNNIESPRMTKESEIWPHEIAKLVTKLSVLSYKKEEDVREVIDEIEFFNNCTEVSFQWFESIGHYGDTQAFAVRADNHLFLVFRGTQELRDFLTDVKIKKRDLYDFQNKEIRRESVHRGFYSALESIWRDDSRSYQRATKKPEVTIADYLSNMFEQNKELELWLGGHSLGGALATITAAKIALGKAESTPFKDRLGGLVTIGCPRVFNRYVSKQLEIALNKNRIFRIFRTLDPVPAIPFMGLNYRHVNGVRTVVGNSGELVVGAKKSRAILAVVASVIVAIENSIGAWIPGNKGRLSVWVSDHSSIEYLKAVEGWDEDDNRIKIFPVVKSGVASLLKILVACGIGGAGLGGTISYFV